MEAVEPAELAHDRRFVLDDPGGGFAFDEVDVVHVPGDVVFGYRQMWAMGFFDQQPSGFCQNNGFLGEVVKVRRDDDAACMVTVIMA